MGRPAHLPRLACVFSVQLLVLKRPEFRVLNRNRMRLYDAGEGKPKPKEIGQVSTLG